MTAGTAWSIMLCTVTPVTSFIITGSPIMSAIPLIIPCVMAGKIILVVCIAVFKNKPNRKIGFPLSMIIGSAAKALFMGIVISMILIPSMLPLRKYAKNM